MEIQNFKLINKGYVVARFDLHIAEWGGMTIKECTLFDKNGSKWVAPPQRSFEAEGKKGYVSLVTFRKEIFEKIQAKAIELLEQEMSSPLSPKNQDEQLELPF